MELTVRTTQGSALLSALPEDITVDALKDHLHKTFASTLSVPAPEHQNLVGVPGVLPDNSRSHRFRNNNAMKPFTGLLWAAGRPRHAEGRWRGARLHPGGDANPSHARGSPTRQRAGEGPRLDKPGMG